MRAELCFGVALCLSVPIAAQAKELSPEEILDRVDDLYRGESSRGRMTMEVRTKRWERTLVAEMWSRGKDRSLVRILSPKKEKGTATLKVGRDMWNYLPKVKRTIKIPSSMMGGSWMGSHFTNDDLVRESRMAEDYDFTITFRGERDGASVIEITCLPKEDAAVVWGKVIVDVGGKDFVPKRVRYFDEDMDLARTMSFHDVRNFGDRRLPSRVRMVPEDEPEELTEITYDELEFDVKLDRNRFSLRKLED